MAKNSTLSPAEVAERAGCTRQTIHKYLTGKTVTIDAILLFDLASALRVSPVWLLRNEGQMQKEPDLLLDQLLAVYSLLSPSAKQRLSDYVEGLYAEKAVAKSTTTKTENGEERQYEPQR